MHPIIAAFIAVVLATPSAFAQRSAEELAKDTLPDTVTVVRVDVSARTLTVLRDEDGRETQVRLDEQTRVQRGSNAIPLAELQPGDRVVISKRAGTPTAGDSGVASVQLVIDSPAQAAAPPAAPAATEPGAGATDVRASMRALDGTEIGEIHVRDTQSGLLVKAKLEGLPSGTKAIHVHAVGRCEPPFESAGDHLDPDRKSHGFLASQGPHGGDLVNLEIGADGKVEQTLRAPDLTLTDLRDADGAAFIIHESADDYTTQPSGNSGKRIACAKIEPAGAAVAQP